jgi:hypothetical protein
MTNVVANVGDELRDIAGRGDGRGRSIVADDIPKLWDKAHTKLFEAGVLARVGPPPELAGGEIIDFLEASETVAARFEDLDLVLHSTWDGRSIDGKQNKNVGPHDVIYLPTSHVQHLLRDDLTSPGIFLPRNHRWRKIAKAVMAHAAITYLLPKLSSMPLQEILRIREAVSDTREGFSMYLQELTAKVDDAIKSGEDFQAVPRSSQAWWRRG